MFVFKMNRKQGKINSLPEEQFLLKRFTFPRGFCPEWINAAKANDVWFTEALCCSPARQAVALDLDTTSLQTPQTAHALNLFYYSQARHRRCFSFRKSL